jgi:hypothetical protein
MLVQFVAMKMNPEDANNLVAILDDTALPGAATVKLAFCGEGYLSCSV